MKKKMETIIFGYMGGCQNNGPFWDTLNIRCRSIIGIQKGTIILTTTPLKTPWTEGGYRVYDIKMFEGNAAA